jgi:putative addiction module antidote
MVATLKLRKVGNSIGLVFPKEALAQMQVGEGDSVCLTEGPDGSFRLTPVTQGKEQFSRQMEAAQDILHRYRNTFRELAK